MHYHSAQIAFTPDISKEQHINRYSHQAMATIFEIYINTAKPDYAEQAAQAAFMEIDRLEAELSRFIENSDISKINALGLNESAIVGPDVLNCLKMCADLFTATGGLFDITAGNLYDTWKYAGKTLAHKSETKQALFPWLYLDYKTFTVKKVNESVSIDLGGFGKGYALDIIRNILSEWDVKSFLINGGMSTVLAEGNDGWVVSLSHPVNQKIIREIKLQGRVLSGSGLNKGKHIINPLSGEPVGDKIAAWSLAGEAAISDALSTAFMIMPENKIVQFCDENKDVAALIIENHEPYEVRLIGHWD